MILAIQFSYFILIKVDSLNNRIFNGHIAIMTHKKLYLIMEL